jgi:hypothetical protein
VTSSQIAEWKTMAADLQRLKFGQLIDIDSLDKMASSAVSLCSGLLLLPVFGNERVRSLQPDHVRGVRMTPLDFSFCR